MASHFWAHGDSQLVLELVYLILQMPRGDTRQAGTEDGAEERGEKVIDRKRGQQLEGKTAEVPQIGFVITLWDTTLVPFIFTQTLIAGRAICECVCLSEYETMKFNYDCY